MSAVVNRLYEYLRSHRIVCILSFLLITSILAFLTSSQNYKEDISDFLPLNNKYNKALKVYQDISGANRIFAIVQYSDSAKSDPDSIIMAVDALVNKLQETDNDHFIDRLTYQVDMEQVANLSSFVYENIPYFLTPKDYARFDSLLARSDYVATQLALDKQMLMFPASDFLAENMQRDPLNLFTPIVRQLQKSNPNVIYDNYDGYIFTPDMKRAIVMMETPFGANETEKNGKLLDFLEKNGRQVVSSMPHINIQFTGGPVIAVGNAKQIKKDSLLSICIAILLIVSLLFWTFRNTWNLMLIVVSIGWGWLFAMGFMALLHDSVSVIVIGISSVIIGIAVNYPLHLIAHLQHTTNVKSALKEIVSPLVIGNITTVGAFLALVPLKSVALRDLGLFSSLLLIGTILFVLMYLPHLLKGRHRASDNIISRIGGFSLDNTRWIVYTVIFLTIIFLYYSFDTVFDSNMNHINYMTKEQKDNLSYFQSTISEGDKVQKVFVVSPSNNIDSSLENNERLAAIIDKMQEDGDVIDSQGCNQFICSSEEQKHRLEYWNAFVAKYGETIEREIRFAAKNENFQEDVFDEFYHILTKKYETQSISYFTPLTSTVFSSNISIDERTKTYSIVNVLYTEPDNVNDIIEKVENSNPECYAFDVQGMNSSIATRLSEDYNYIGWVCGLIVFIFLWFSFGSIELALLSFLPMAISWIWILGIMSILDIHFNVVNVILATFIFGQGDDYTIFMTEGCQYEYAYRRKMLASYKNSIIISALIMFIGIGALILAKHPALHSLAEVTIVGMFSVVLMAYLFPPLLFKWLVSSKGSYRIRPINLKAAFVTGYSAIVFFCQLATVYVLGFLLFKLSRPNKKSKLFFRNYIRRCFWFDMNHIWGVHFLYENPYNETFSNPAIIICNHQSMLDTAYLMAVSSKIAIVSNSHANNYSITKKVFQWMDFYSIPDDQPIDEQHLSDLIDAGYCILIFPEGERNAKSSILRFHKGAFRLAIRFHLDIIPMMIHGVNHVFPRNTICTYPGTVTLRVGKRIHTDALECGDDYVELTKKVRQSYIQTFEDLKQKTENAKYFSNFVIDRYRYKGHGILKTVKRNLRHYENYSQWVDTTMTGISVIINSQWGEMPLIMALLHPGMEIIAVEEDDDKACVANYACEGVVQNIDFRTKIEIEEVQLLRTKNNSVNVILLHPTSLEIVKYAEFNPVIIK